MQRKNRFLNQTTYKKNRSGFAMIMAIMVIVIISTILALQLRMTADVGKKTTDVYLHEQAILLTRASTEAALLGMSANNRNAGGCLNTINAVYPSSAAPLFNITITMNYIGLLATAPTCNSLVDNVTTTESIGNVMIDVVVNSTPTASPEPIRYHRRTIQKL